MAFIFASFIEASAYPSNPPKGKLFFYITQTHCSCSDCLIAFHPFLILLNKKVFTNGAPFGPLSIV